MGLSIKFDCPPPEALEAIDKPTCPVKFGQIQRLAFRLVPDSTVATPTFADIDDLEDSAKWVAAIAAADRTKIVLTPFISAIVIPPGAVIEEEGGNNNTINGIPILEGQSLVKIAGKIYNLDPEIAKQLRTLTQFSALTPGFSDLECFMFNEFGHIICNYTGEDLATGVPSGIRVFNFTVPSVGSEGLLKPNVNNVEFAIDGTWDQKLMIGKPTELEADSWNPLELWPVVVEET